MCGNWSTLQRKLYHIKPSWFYRWHTISLYTSPYMLSQTIEENTASGCVRLPELLCHPSEDPPVKKSVDEPGSWELGSSAHLGVAYTALTVCLTLNLDNFFIFFNWFHKSVSASCWRANPAFSLDIFHTFSSNFSFPFTEVLFTTTSTKKGHNIQCCWKLRHSSNAGITSPFKSNQNYFKKRRQGVFSQWKTSWQDYLLLFQKWRTAKNFGYW